MRSQNHPGHCEKWPGKEKQTNKKQFSEKKKENNPAWQLLNQHFQNAKFRENSFYFRGTQESTNEYWLSGYMDT